MKITLLFLLAFILFNCGGNADNLNINDTAPDFTLQDAYGNSYTLSAYREKSTVVIYFYPKANTSGCTKQACGIRDEFSKFEENNIVVLGISVDDTESIGEFIDDYNLNFPLLSDADKKVSEAYGVLNDLGIASRITFIINKDGNIAEIIRNVDVDTHAEDVFDIASKLK